MNIERPIRSINVGTVAPEGDAKSLLGGLMVDAAGRLMMLSAAGSGRARYYASTTSERIAAARVERHALSLLRRLHLIDPLERPRDLTVVLRRIVVFPDRLVFQLDRRACVAIWRAQGRLLSRTATADVMRAISAWVPSGCEISDVGWVLCLSAPRRSRRQRRVAVAELRPEA